MRGHRKIIIAGMVALIAACDSSSEPEPDVFNATLAGANERPTPNNSTANGHATFTVNSNRTISYSLAVSGMTPTAQHIHGPADAEHAAGVIVFLTIGDNQVLTPTSFTGTVSYDSLLVLLDKGQAYVNVHSATFGAGEIRGQLTKQ